MLVGVVWLARILAIHRGDVHGMVAAGINLAS